MSRSAVWGLDATRYARHGLHADASLWLEKNCYIDVWIEVLHAAKLEPLAVLPFTLATDFDGDQWTFFKPAHKDITHLYGVSVQELNVWKPILEHALFHAAEGRLIFTEADAFWLPDTQGTDYRAQHTKSTIVIESVDVERQELGYFHNAGYFKLEGEDFVQTFRLGFPSDPTFMPLFAELVKLDRVERLEPTRLAARSRELLPDWFARRPPQNPFVRFLPRFTEDIESLKPKGVGAYHAYAFATIRQFGANFELLAEYLRWLSQFELGSFRASAEHFLALSGASKTLILKAARAVNSKKPADFSEAFAELTTRYDAGISELAKALGA